MLRQRMLMLLIVLLIAPGIALAQTAGTMAEETPGCREKCVTALGSDGYPIGYGCITGPPNSGGTHCFASTYMCMQVISECWGWTATPDGLVVSTTGGCRLPDPDDTTVHELALGTADGSAPGTAVSDAGEVAHR